MVIRRRHIGARRRRTSSGGGTLILVLALIVGILISASFRTVGGRTTPAVLWYIDATTHEFVAVTSSAKLPVRSVEQAGTLMERLKTPPADQGLTTAVPAGLSVRQATLLPDGIFHVVLSTGHDLRPMGYVEEERLYWQLVNSLLSLPGVRSVELSVDGRTVGAFLSFVKTEREFTVRASMLDEGTSVDLYFVTTDGKYAVEERTVPAGLTRSQLALQAVRSLMNGPVHPSLVSPLPDPSTLRGVTVDGGTVTVDFDEKVWNESMGPDREQQMLDTLVLTLTRLPGVDHVHLQVGGNDVAGLFGNVDASGSLQRLDGRLEAGKALAVYHLVTVDGDKLPVLTVYPQSTPLTGRNAMITRAVALLTAPGAGDTTMVSKGAGVTSMLLDSGTGVLQISLHLSSLPRNGQTSSILVEQLRLTLTEIPSIMGVHLAVNGSSSFLPGGYYIGSIFQR